MKLYLKGHAERYPVEQLQMQLFGDRPTQFVETPFSGEDGAVSSLHDGKFTVPRRRRSRWTAKQPPPRAASRSRRPMCA